MTWKYTFNEILFVIVFSFGYLFLIYTINKCTLTLKIYLT